MRSYLTNLNSKNTGRIRIAFLLLFALLPFPQLFAQEAQVSIIPRPVSMVLEEGYFTIDENTSIHLQNTSNELQAAAAFFSSYIHNISGYPLPVRKKESNAIQLRIEKIRDIGKEGYQLDVSPEGIKISANTKAGIVYGMQSIFQALPQIRTNAPLKVPAMEVIDYPRFKWRGMHLDVSRHFFSPDVVKEYINLLATYKLNTFHWHLVDDQGWRIAIKQYPELTKVGAWRVDQNDKVWGERPQAKAGEPATYGGYYTQEQIKDIIAYAAQRNITIVPEIEMPGHVASAIAAFPHLSCAQKSQLPLTGGDYSGIASNYCAGNEAVFTFLENVLDEVVALFPSQYIHIGGDEVNKASWEKCPRCQARIKAEGLKDENELQSYFIQRIEKYLNGKGRQIIGWDEILEGGLAPQATVMSWRGESGGITAAKMGHDVIMTPGKPLYFDHYQAGPAGEPLAIGGFNTLKDVYGYDPVPEALTAEEASYILGAQANVWAEYITSVEHLEYMVLPRMLALAEVVWSPKESKDWENFNQRLPYHFNAFEQKGLNFSRGNFTVAIKPVSENGKVFVNLSSEAIDGSIFYTLDGSVPTAQSRQYIQPVPIDSSVTLKAITVVNGQAKDAQVASQAFVSHEAIGRNVAYAHPVNKHYLADGPNSLTDGVRGTSAVGKYWHGFYAKDLSATIDLGEAKEISSMAIGCLQHYRDWIFLPTSVKFEVSTNGKHFKEVAVVQHKVDVNEPLVMKDFVARFLTLKARFIRVTAQNLGLCPEGHNGEGKPAWLFADEIIVK